MEYDRLGTTDLRVSRIGLGCEPLAGVDWGNVDVGAAVAAVGRALERGITVFDTADVYGLGLGERRLSEALGARRHEVVIVSKFGVAWKESGPGGRAATYRDARPERVKQALEDSLRRLRIDCVPLYLLHWPDPDTPLQATLETLVELKAQGKLRHFGVSNFQADEIREALRLAPLGAVELHYGLLERQVESSILPLAEGAGLGVLAYGALGQGVLTGKYGAETRFPETDRRHRLPRFSGTGWHRSLVTAARVQQTAAKLGRKAGQVAIRWVLDNPAVHCAIVGAKTPDQVDENADAAGWQLPEEERHYLESLEPHETPRP